MTRAFRASLLAGACALLPASAWAADVTAAQASEVEAQMRNWLAAMLGPAVPITGRPVQVTAAGDHFDVVVPIRPPAATGSTEIKVTATARPLENGKWSIEGIKTAMPLRFTIDMPVPPVDGKPAKPPTVPVTYDIAITGQDGQLLYDPSFGSPSTYTGSTKGATITATGGPLNSKSRIGPTNSVTTLRPAGPDRVDVAIDGTIQDYQIATETADTGPVEIGMNLVRVNMGMSGISRTRATVLAQTLAGAFNALLTAPAGAPPKIAPDLAKQMLAALQDFASEATLEESFEGFRVAAAGMQGQLATAKVGFGAKSDAGLLAARMELAAKGLTLPGLDLGPIMQLVPTELSLRPVVSGIGVAELTRIIQAAGDKRDPDPKDIAALFSHGGIVTGLDSLSVAVGGAIIAGQGKITMTSPQQFSGSGQITAAGFDGLMEKVSDIPEAAQAVPVLALVKGMGKTVDDKLVWAITYDGTRLMVNNVDVMKMMGGGPAGGAPKEAPPRAGRPTPNRK